MQPFIPFAMERWQSVHEHRVHFNLSESGVHPVRLGELLEMGGASLEDTVLGYGQSNGSDELRSRIASLYPGANDANVVVTNGSAEANFVALWDLIERGDEIAVLVPAYMQLHGLAGNFGAAVTEIPLREELGWQPDPDDVARLVTNRTRAIVVTNPGNPTGVVLRDDVRSAIVEAADRTGAWILADEVYTGAELNGTETPSFFGRHERVIATGSLSKAYGMPGLRIGWIAADPAVAGRTWARRDYTTISPGAISDRLARVALDPVVRPRLTARTRSIIRAGVEILEGWMDRQGCFSWVRPDAGAIVFARLDLPVSAADLAERLRVEDSVLVVPGEQFNCDSFIRFGVGNEQNELVAALDCVSRRIDAIRQGHVACSS